MPAEFIKEHQSEISRVIVSVVRETFLSYFGLNIYPDALAICVGESAHNPNRVSYEAIVCGQVMTGSIVVTLEEGTLLKLSQIVYPPNIATERSAFEGCAEEIANIVGTRVKNFLNHYNLDLSMGTPKPRGTPAGTNNFIHMSFQVDKKPMFIDFVIDEHSPCHLDT